MDFMLIMLTDRNTPENPEVFAEMGKFAGELAAQGKLKGGAPLRPEVEGARIRQPEAAPIVTDGPFTETKEVIGGFFMIDCESREEALAIARRCPHARIGTVELRQTIPVGPPS